MKVCFNSVKEFCEELEKDHLGIDRRIVRTTVRYEGAKISPNIHHVYAMATYSVDGQVVELDKYCGDTWGLKSESDDKVLNTVQDCLKKVEEVAGQCNCEVRAGRLEE